MGDVNSCLTFPWLITKWIDTKVDTLFIEMEHGDKNLSKSPLSVAQRITEFGWHPFDKWWNHNHCIYMDL